ncbi:MAG: hypothetical protein RDU76_05865 [Candidatus Edwardsbacteria bacterium]|nr:hypothetical protein [Candidatus Edwardsbacteria bacterium]
MLIYFFILSAAETARRYPSATALSFIPDFIAIPRFWAAFSYWPRRSWTSPQKAASQTSL